MMSALDVSKKIELKEWYTFENPTPCTVWTVNDILRMVPGEPGVYSATIYSYIVNINIIEWCYII